MAEDGLEGPHTPMYRGQKDGRRQKEHCPDWQLCHPEPGVTGNLYQVFPLSLQDQLE